MATFTKGECLDPSQLFLYVDLIKFRPHSSLTSPLNKTIVNDVDSSPLDIAYLWRFVPMSLLLRQATRVHQGLSPGCFYQ